MEEEICKQFETECKAPVGPLEIERGIERQKGSAPDTLLETSRAETRALQAVILSRDRTVAQLTEDLRKAKAELDCVGEVHVTTKFSTEVDIKHRDTEIEAMTRKLTELTALVDERNLQLAVEIEKNARLEASISLRPSPDILAALLQEISDRNNKHVESLEARVAELNVLLASELKQRLDVEKKLYVCESASHESKRVEQAMPNSRELENITCAEVATPKNFLDDSEIERRKQKDQEDYLQQKLDSMSAPSTDLHHQTTFQHDRSSIPRLEKQVYTFRISL
jgi:hypothetical protein